METSKQKMKSWKNENWENFSLTIKERDNYKCFKCGRGDNESILQVHHLKYKPNKKPWEYELDDCVTLCKGCHAREHNIIEPTSGWTLLSIDDLGNLSGICERENCGQSIRYEHLTYHPNWGYKIVGSTCIDYLTQTDKLLSQEVVKIYRQINKFLEEITWEIDFTKKGKRYLIATYKYHQIRIYGNDLNYAFQLVIKEKGVKWHDFKDIVPLYKKSLEVVKEVAFIALKGTLASTEKEKNILRCVYKSIR